MSGAAWSNWSAGTIAGHANELAILQEQVPEATMAEAALSDSQPCVVAWADALVIIIAGRPVQRGAGRVEVRVDGRSASMRQGDVSCVYAPVPFALTCQTLGGNLT